MSRDGWATARASRPSSPLATRTSSHWVGPWWRIRTYRGSWPPAIPVRASDGEEQTIGPFDSVVVAVGTRPNHELLAPLQARGIEVVGDAHEPLQIMGAVQSAWQAARTL